jgi:DNA-3-methyladenine glycosylase I
LCRVGVGGVCQDRGVSGGSGVVIGADGVARCPWGDADEEMRAYHDIEWGVPVEGESAYFERLTLEAFQSGLSWRTILRKRPAFRAAFDGFDVDAIAAYDDADRERLMADAGIVRNRVKIDAAIVNAGATVALREYDGLVALVERHRPDPPPPGPRTTADVLPTTAESVALSKSLKKAGFAFVGPTTMHALMQALGLVDDHLLGCHRRGAIS